MNPVNPTITDATVTRRESYQTWRKRHDQETAHHSARAQSAAHHVMDVIHAISGPLPPAGPRTGSHPAAQTMDEKVAEIVMKPQTTMHFVDPMTIRLAQRVTATLAALMLFLAGVAVGKVW